MTKSVPAPRSFAAKFGRVAIVLTALLLTPAAIHADNINAEMLKHAPAVLSQLHEKGLRTVGVLKFRVQKPGEKTSDAVGPVNSLVADRLEIALILANPFGEGQLSIIKDASGQAEKIDGASHLTKEGRAKFFGPKFELAWSGRAETADAFVTGILQMNADRTTAKVALLYFDRNGSELERIGDVFEVNLDVNTVTELGESFLLRGAFDDGQTSIKPTTTVEVAPEVIRQELDDRIVKEAKRVQSQSTVFPLQDTAAPVSMELMYDGKVMPVEIRNGRAFVAEPSEGQKVEFALSRASFVQGTLGIVLKVNGENTLYRQTVRDLDCSKWLLTPDYTRTIIKGYQMPESNTSEKFTVLSARESARRAVDYGRSVGQIQLTVFQESQGPPVLSPVSNEDEDLLAMLRGVHPGEVPSSLDLLKTRIRNSGNDTRTRGGLVVPGAVQSNAIEVKKFTPDPTPIMSVTITYYTP